MTGSGLLRILVVDDDPEEQELLLLAFQRVALRPRLHSVNSGNKAVAYLKGEGSYSDRGQFPYPSMLITDLKMPDGDGFAILEHLKGTPHHRIGPTIVMSASSDADDVKKALALGATSYFVKPDRFEALQRLVELLCELWVWSERPLVDATGRQLETNGIGKLGERFHAHLSSDDSQLDEQSTHR